MSQSRFLCRQVVLGCFLCGIGISVLAHHAPTEFNFLALVQIEGTIVEVKWQNPHVSFKVRVVDAQGKAAIWEIEGSAISMMRRTNAAGVRPSVGEKVRVAGNPSRRTANRLYGLNMLRANGVELVFHPEGRPRWGGKAVGNSSVWFDATVEPSSAGIFRVWSTKFDDPWLSAVPRDRLTDAAKAKLSTWNPVTDSVTVDCEPVGVPMIMGQPYPMEFVQASDQILLRIESYDLVRVIHMSDRVSRSSLPVHLLGRSTGRWEGSTLVVTTDGIAWPFLEYSGTPLSPESSLVERFTPSADGTRLSYSVVVTDPQYLTNPVTLTRAWVARPNESVKPYKCGAPAESPAVSASSD